MHGEPLPEMEPEYPMTAIYRETAPQPTAPWALPGNYSVVLTAGGKSFTQPLTLKMDPRVKATEAELTKQFELSKRLQDLRAELQPIGKSYEALVGELEKAKERAGEASMKQPIENLRKKLEEFADPAAVRCGRIAGVGCAEESRETRLAICRTWMRGRRPSRKSPWETCNVTRGPCWSDGKACRAEVDGLELRDSEACGPRTDLSSAD